MCDCIFKKRGSSAQPNLINLWGATNAFSACGNHRSLMCLHCNHKQKCYILYSLEPSIIRVQFLTASTEPAPVLGLHCISSEICFFFSFLFFFLYIQWVFFFSPFSDQKASYQKYSLSRSLSSVAYRRFIIAYNL